MIAILLFVVSAAVVFWVYLGYPLSLALLDRVRSRPRRRAPLQLPITVIVPAHNEGAIIGEKVQNILSSAYPRASIEIVVASDGSDDRTVEEARRAGADRVLDLPRIGKVGALNAAAAEATGEILVFTDADCLFDGRTLTELVANFADESVGGVTGNESRRSAGDHGGVARGEGVYWRYEQWIKRLEDRVGSTVSACGSLHAIRRSLFRPPQVTSGNDDVLISTQVVRAGRRLAFDENALVFVESNPRGRDEFRRKIRVVNGGLRTWFALSDMLDPRKYGLYALEVLTRKILRRFLPFALLAVLVSSIWLCRSNPWWWIVLAPQLLVLALAACGWMLRDRSVGRRRPFSVPFYFALANLASGAAVLSVLVGVRYESWSPSGRDETVVRTPS